MANEISTSNNENQGLMKSQDKSGCSSNEISQESLIRMQRVAERIGKDGKGLLAADESEPSIGKRFSAVNIENNVENRRKYRTLLVEAVLENLDNISGVIFHIETFEQKNDNGQLLRECLLQKDCLVGLKVDEGLEVLNEHGEALTKGMDNLQEVLRDAKSKGVSFAKWRATFKISQNLPSKAIMHLNCDTLARYALACQMNGIVPIVEPEVLCDSDHSIQQCYSVTKSVLSLLFLKLRAFNVILSATILKPNMIIPGLQSSSSSTPEEVAIATVSVLADTVPCSVPSIVFLSGGLSENSATQNLTAINNVASSIISSVPWNLSFSFGRALQASVLQTWRANSSNYSEAKKVFSKLASQNRIASTSTQSSTTSTTNSTSQSIKSQNNNAQIQQATFITSLRKNCCA